MRTYCHMVMETVTKNESINRPLPKKRAKIATHRSFTMAEMARIRRGFLPTGSDDRWFIYFSRNRLYLHRSWTGFCIYVAHFKHEGNRWILYLIEANRDSAQYSETIDANDARLGFELIDILLLRCPEQLSCEVTG